MRHRCSIFLSIAFVVGCSVLTSAQEVSLPQPSSASKVAPPVSIRSDRMTGHIHGRALGEVLDEVTRLTGVAFVLADVIYQDVISAELQDMPVDEALRHLLSKYDAFFYYGVVGSAPSRLRAVWIYPEGAAVALRPVPPETWAGAGELEASVTDSNPKVRERAYEALMDGASDRGHELVLDAIRGLGEPDQGVRQRLLSNATTKGMEVPPNLLADLVRGDDSENMRLMALDLLATTAPQTAKQVAETALNDPSQTVRERAADILGERHHP